MFIRATFNYSDRNLHNCWISYQTLLLLKTSGTKQAVTNGLSRTRKHYHLTLRSLGIGWCVQHVQHISGQIKSQVSKAAQHLMMWSVDSWWSSIAPVMGWKCAREGSTIRAVAEHRLYGTIIEWELKTKLEIIVML